MHQRALPATRANPYDVVMTTPHVLILGANGRLARVVAHVLLRDTDARLSLYLRRAQRLPNPDPTRATVVEGDVLDAKKLREALRDVDVVYANLAGDLRRQAVQIVDAMRDTDVKRIVLCSSMGIYDEVAGQRYSSMLDPYRDGAAVIEHSELDWTILRPGWFTNDDRIDHVLTQKGEPFIGHDVSLASIADVVRSIVVDPAKHRRESLGIARR